MGQQVVVIGAGIIGAVSAIEALDAGHAVTLLDPATPGGEQAASYGNAGWLSSHSVLPPAEPGLWKKLPRFLLDRSGPLTIRWAHLPRATPWLLRYLASGWTAQRVAVTAAALRSLLVDAAALHTNLARRAGVPELIQQRGLLHLYRDPADFEKERAGWQIRHANGVRWDELDAAALRRAEPGLQARYGFAVRVPEAGQCTDPGAYVAALAAYARVRGATLVAGRARGFCIEGRRLRAVHLDANGQSLSLDCDAAVIAAGIHSQSLAAQAGDRVPLQSERGYHIQIPHAAVMPRHSFMAADRKVVVSPMRGGLRVAGQVEIAGVHAAPDWRRADILLQHLTNILPDLIEPGASAPATRWLGHRPSTCDGLPCIGRASACDNIIHAFGHGHVGLVSAARTGRLVAQLLSRQTPEIDLSPFAATRFV